MSSVRPSNYFESDMLLLLTMLVQKFISETTCSFSVREASRSNEKMRRALFFIKLFSCSVFESIELDRIRWYCKKAGRPSMLCNKFNETEELTFREIS